VDPRADQFSLAVIVYELLTGKRPVGHFKPPSHLNRQLHPAVDTVLVRALQEDPDDRYSDTRAFAAALDQSLRRRPRRRPRVATLAAAVLAVALALGGLAVWGISRGDGEARVHLAEPRDRSAETQYFVDQGDLHLEGGRERDAESCYAEAIRLSPRNPLPYLKRAFMYKQCEAHQQALDDLQTALDLEPKLVEAWIGRGSIYVNLKDYQRAIPALDRAILLDAAAAEAWAYRGWARYKLGQDDLASRDLDAAVAADRECGVAYQFRALFHQARKQYELACSDFEAALRCMPDNPFMHSGLALLLANWKDASAADRQRAVEHAREACELTQWSDWRQLRILATASAAAGDIPAAIRCCEKAVELAPVTSRKALENQLAGYQKRTGTGTEIPP
jgi:tetratricopeptide (TPR) repeat protein